MRRRTDNDCRAVDVAGHRLRPRVGSSLTQLRAVRPARGRGRRGRRRPPGRRRRCGLGHHARLGLTAHWGGAGNEHHRGEGKTQQTDDGLASKDFVPALEEFFGSKAGLSASVITG